MSYPLRIAGLAAACLMTFASAATAQAAPNSAVREACKSSIQTLCPAELAAMDRSAVRACLIKNINKAAPACQAAVKAAWAAQSATPTKQ